MNRYVTGSRACTSSHTGHTHHMVHWWQIAAATVRGCLNAEIVGMQHLEQHSETGVSSPRRRERPIDVIVRRRCGRQLPHLRQNDQAC